MHGGVAEGAGDDHGVFAGHDQGIGFAVAEGLRGDVAAENLSAEIGDCAPDGFSIRAEDSPFDLVAADECLEFVDELAGERLDLFGYLSAFESADGDAGGGVVDVLGPDGDYLRNSSSGRPEGSDEEAGFGRTGGGGKGGDVGGGDVIEIRLFSR